MDYQRAEWRLLPVIAGDGFDQMSLDHALMISASREESQPTLRFYRFKPPALTVGRFQPLRHIDQGACKRLGINVVRRPTGGKAILHKDDFTYSLTMPPSANMPDSVEESYVMICRGIIEALAQLGVEASLVPRTPYELNRVHACFSSPAAADLAVRGRKLCGSAQTRKAGGLLQHGTILRLDNTSLLCELFTYGKEELSQRRRELARACTCLDELGVCAAWEDIAEAFVRGFERAFTIRLVPGELSGDENTSASALRLDYASEVWSQSV
jgi:lipoate-protein ligase A